MYTSLNSWTFTFVELSLDIIHRFHLVQISNCLSLSILCVSQSCFLIYHGLSIYFGNLHFYGDRNIYHFPPLGRYNYLSSIVCFSQTIRQGLHLSIACCGNGKGLHHWFLPGTFSHSWGSPCYYC